MKQSVVAEVVSTATGASGTVALVHPNTVHLKGYAECVEVLEWLGYDIRIADGLQYEGTPEGTLLFDRRCPNWYSWKGAISPVTVMYPQEMREYHRYKDAVCAVRTATEVLDQDDPSCYS